jgi:hypothetical protein
MKANQTTKGNAKMKASNEADKLAIAAAIRRTEARMKPAVMLSAEQLSEVTEYIAAKHATLYDAILDATSPYLRGEQLCW